MKSTIRFVLLLIAGSLHLCVHAQDEDLDHFYHQYRAVVLSAAQSKAKSVTIRLHTAFSDKYSGERTKLKITFLNDSVFQQRYRLRKSTYIIRGDDFFPYDRDTALFSGIGGLTSIDSAGYFVNWGKAYEGMKDSSAISYSRMKFDSLGRLVDYYYTYDSTCTQMVSQYFGDTLSITNSWSCEGDSMVLNYSDYRLKLYNEDSTFYITKLKYTQQSDGAYRRWNNFTEKGYITYDDKGRIVEVRIEELSTSLDGNAWPFSHVMRVSYK